MKKSNLESHLSRENKNEPSLFLILLFLTFVVCLLSYPLFRHEYFPGDDWAYHLARIEGIKDGLLLGEFPVKIHAFLLNGYGYGNGFFYPDFFLYIPALFRIGGITLIAAYKIFLFIIILTIVTSTFLCARHILHDRFSAICATMLYAASHMVIVNIYWRAALGESIASIFIPVVICGAYNLTNEKFTKPWILFAGFLGLMFSHMISLAMALFYTLVVVAVNFRKIWHKDRKEKKREQSGDKIVIKFLFSAVLVLLLSISFWLPMLEQMANDTFQYMNPYTDFSNNAIEISDLLIFSRGSLGLPLAMFSGISIFILLFSLVTKESGEWIQTHFYLIAGILFSIAATKIFPWKFFAPILEPIQFPWRILTLASFCLALGIAVICSRSFESVMGRALILVIICIIGSSFGINLINMRWEIFRSDVPIDVYNSYLSTGVGQEWLPLGTDTSKLIYPMTAFNEDRKETAVSKNGTTVFFKTDAGSEYYDIPLLFYKGYSAQIVKQDESIEELSIVKSGSNLVRVLNPENESGHITVYYCGTIVQKISYVINGMTILIVLIILFLRYRILLKHKNYNHLSNGLL